MQRMSNMASNMECPKIEQRSLEQIRLKIDRRQTEPS